MDLVKFSVFWFFICLSFYLLFVGLVHGRNQFDCMLYQYELVFCSAKFPAKKIPILFGSTELYSVHSDGRRGSKSEALYLVFICLGSCQVSRDYIYGSIVCYKAIRIKGTEDGNYVRIS